MNATQIGTVQVLRDRVYLADDYVTEVCVPPGRYPLMREEDGTTYWVMVGKENERFVRIGEPDSGLFAMRASDSPTGPNRTVTSMKYTPQEWADFLANDPLVVGSADVRRLYVEVAV